MAPSLLHLAFLLSLTAPQTLSAYVWPSKGDVLEDLLAIQSGYLRFGFSDLTTPCDNNAGIEGRQVAADWIRAAFHDAATHDKAAGTGGLDASLAFEWDRPENLGAFINSTFNDMVSFVTPRSSASDILALALVTAVGACGGQRIPLRMGRVDAAQAGQTGVPEPTDTLQQTQKDFTRMGFSTQDMITLVACGHTIGGVHSVDFPEITGGQPSAANVTKFDSSFAAFDTKVVTEYLQGRGTNPLLFGHNDTTNSDKRVFGADKNVTMKSLSSPGAFQSKCASAFERMINTVPNGVKLSDPVDIIDLKPYINRMELNGSSSLAFEGRIRVRTSASTGRKADGLGVTLDLVDRQGKHSTIKTTRPTLKLGQSLGIFNEEFTWFEFATKVPIASGMQKFNIQLKQGNANAQVFGNAGTGGFPVKDDLLFLQSKSCLNTKVVDGNMTLHVEAAMRQTYTPPTLMLTHKIPRPGVVLPRLQTVPVPMKQTGTSGPYTIYSISTSLESSGWDTVFDIVSGSNLTLGPFLTTSMTSDTCIV